MLYRTDTCRVAENMAAKRMLKSMRSATNPYTEIKSTGCGRETGDYKTTIINSNTEFLNTVFELIVAALIIAQITIINSNTVFR
jgi:hypothetical protein